MSEVVVSGVRRLSTISERDVDPGSELQSLGGSEWKLCSHGKPSMDSSTLTSFESYQPDAADDCATLLLACLYCRFCDVMTLLPDACERGFVRCFPSYTYFTNSNEQNKSKECCSCNVEFDCGLMSSCHETSEFLELAMEISEVCYR